MTTPDKIPISTPGRFSSIDFLRGFAALSVLIFHTRAIAWVGITAWQKNGNSRNYLDIALGYASIPFRYGYWGVPLLFVISGFCIHQATINTIQRTGKFSLIYYAKRRLFRIYPVLISCLVLTAFFDFLSKSLIGHFPARELTWSSFF